MSHKHKSAKAVIAAAIGNFCEIYDFAVFGFSVPFIAAHFFPPGDTTAAIINTFAIYAVAFVARPIGGLFFGYFADTVGRIRMLSWTIWLMAASTAAIGLVPTYSSIGLWAPILLVACRLGQGFALGGETSGSTSFVLESAPEGGRGRSVGFVWFVAQIPNATVALILLGIQLGFGKEAYVDWIWRIPFVAGGLIGVVGYWIRTTVSDPDEFKQARQAAVGAKSFNPFLALGRSGLREMLNVALVLPLQTVGAYLLLGYLYTFLVKEVGLASTTALLVNACVIMAYAIGYLIGGSLSDRLGRKPVMTAAAVWIAASAYPALSIAAQGDTVGLLVGPLLLALGVGTYSGACFVAAVEFFPTSYRATGHALSYQVTVAVLGGTTPLVSAWLVSAFHSPLAPGYYLTVVAMIGLALIQFVPETKGVLLRKGDR